MTNLPSSENKLERAWRYVLAFFRAWRDMGIAFALRKVRSKLRREPVTLYSQRDYEAWIEAFEPSTDELVGQVEAAKHFDYQPTISFIIPVFNPPENYLREAIDSVIAQTYGKWEMCIVDASDRTPDVRDLLQGYSQQDHRIKVQYLKKNHGIAGNSNQALKMANGEFVALLDHDDILAPNALFEIVSALNQKPDTDLIYFDEDKLSPSGQERHNPWFKPDWSPELLLSANFMMHSVFRKQMVMDLGGFDTTMDGAQDWDLVFRCIEQSENIIHIPKVLYHWREVEGSAAENLYAKPWAFDRQLRAVAAHLGRIGLENAEAFFQRPGIIRVRWPDSGSKVSIVIPTRDEVKTLRKCIRSIVDKTNYKNFEIIIVDNESDDQETLKYYAELEKLPTIKIVQFPGAFNYSAANNLGAGIAVGEVLLFLNNDVEILDPEWLVEMLRWVEWDEIGIVGAKLLYPNGTIQHAGVIVGMQGHASHVFMGVGEHLTSPYGSDDWYRNYSAVTGACMMIRKEVFDHVGGFSEEYQLVFSDVELCIRIGKQGYRILYDPFVRLRHYEGTSRGKYIPVEDIQMGYQHLKDLVKSDDPYYNENLSYGTCIPTLIKEHEITRIERLEEIVAYHSRNE